MPYVTHQVHRDLSNADPRLGERMTHDIRLARIQIAAAVVTIMSVIGIVILLVLTR